MKPILYTQRVEVIESYDERRDCADQRIVEFFYQCGFLPIAVPNYPSLIKEYVQLIQPIGLVLTGGNSLKKYGGNTAEKDMVDKMLISLAIEQDIPLLGFCRGMQSIFDYFNHELKNVENHIAVRHSIRFRNADTLEVNSYHQQGSYDVKKPLRKLAESEDGIIEAVCHQNKKILGIMWHPEREDPFRITDINLVQKLFFKGEIAIKYGDE